MKTFILYIFSALILTSVCFGQNGYVPVNLGPTVNTNYPELSPVISPDGKTLYFVRANHPENNCGKLESQDIWVTYKTDTSWTLATRLSKPFNTAKFNSVLAISPDGNTIYINGIFDKKLRWKKRGVSAITKLSELDYSTPKALKIKRFSKVSKGNFGQIFINDAGNVMLFSYSKRWYGNRNDLFVSTKKENGKWSKPKKLYGKVNSRKSELAPSLSKDDSKLYFTSERANAKGSYDIFVADKLDNTYRKWSEPKALSDTINTLKWESYYSLNGKGSFAYYTSNATGNGSSDIFRIKIFEENPYVVVSGRIINRHTGQPLSSDKKVKLYINGQPADSVKIDSSNGTFKVSLPLGKQYLLAGKADNYTSIIDTVNATKVRDFTQWERTLYLEPVPYALIYGRINVAGSSDKITMANHPVILINNKKVDSLTIDENGNFKVKLPYGKAYVVEVSADKYQAGQLSLDLRGINEYAELNKDLYVSKIEAPKVKEAIITGRIINNKTKKGIDKSINAEIFVNEKAAVADIKDSVYTLNLPLGAKYVINASVKDFYPVYETIDLTKETENLKVFRDLNISPLEVGASVKLNNIFFETGKSKLKPTSFPELDRVVKFMTEYSSLKIEIGGHTDNVGNAAANKKLSQARAKAVADYIIKKGISSERIVSTGYGMEKPVASNKTTAGKAQNRRVEFTILDK